MDAELQEWLALGVVALVAGTYVAWRRRRKAGSCGDCASAGPPRQEQVVRFYRRAPGPDGSASGSGRSRTGQVAENPPAGAARDT
jgi:hypothetical protein